MYKDKAHAMKQGQAAADKLREAGAFNVAPRRGLGRGRIGKTAQDHASGAWKQRLDNRAARNSGK